MSWHPVDNYSPRTLNSGCLICRNNDVRQTANGPEPILSTQVETWDGIPDICATCIGEAAGMLGYHSDAEFTKVTSRLAETQVQLDELASTLDEKTATIKTLTHELSGALSAVPDEKPATVRQHRTKATA